MQRALHEHGGRHDGGGRHCKDAPADRMAPASRPQAEPATGELAAMGEQRMRVTLTPAAPRLPAGLALALDLPGLAAALLVLPARAALGRPALALEPAAASAWGECFVGWAPATQAAPGRLGQGRGACFVGCACATRGLGDAEAGAGRRRVRRGAYGCRARHACPRAGTRGAPVAAGGGEQCHVRPTGAVGLLVRSACVASQRCSRLAAGKQLASDGQE